MENLVGFSGMAPDAKSLHISDEPGIFETGKFFIGDFSVAV